MARTSFHIEFKLIRVTHFQWVSFHCIRLLKRKILEITKLMSCINFTMIKAAIKLFKTRNGQEIYENSNDAFRYNAHGTVNIPWLSRNNVNK